MQFVGVDQHKKFSYMAVLDDQGRVTKEGRVSNSREALRRFLNNPHPDGEKVAVLEAGRNWTVMYDWLEEERVKRLLSIPSIGKFFALLISTEIDDITRFKNPDKLAAYAGLIPSTYSSGNRTFHGRITKQGNKYLRWAFVEAVWPAIRADLSLRLYYQRVKNRKGANPAKVATARRLAKIVYRVLSEERDYIPGRPHFHLTEAS